MKLVFLDIDGVLNTVMTPGSTKNKIERRCVDALNRLSDTTGALFVVSSVWRKQGTLSDLRILLKKIGVTGFILDKTPVHYNGRRGPEIKAWLDKYNECPSSEYGAIEKFIILDDEVSDKYPVLKHVVHCDMFEGLTEERVDSAIRILTHK